MFIIVAVGLNAQNDTTNINFDYVSGMGIMDFVSANSGTLITIVGILITEFIIGKSSSIKGNSTIEFILNLIVKLFSKK